jgi:hypothetical protein
LLPTDLLALSRTRPRPRCVIVKAPALARAAPRRAGWQGALRSSAAAEPSSCSSRRRTNPRLVRWGRHLVPLLLREGLHINPQASRHGTIHGLLPEEGTLLHEALLASAKTKQSTYKAASSERLLIFVLPVIKFLLLRSPTQTRDRPVHWWMSG